MTTYEFTIKATVSTFETRVGRGANVADAWKRLGLIDSALAYGLVRGDVSFKVLPC